MPTVDFTLEDIRIVIVETVEKTFDRKFQLAFDRAFKPAFDAAFEPWALAIQEDFNQVNQRLDRLEGDVAEIKTDLKGLTRVVNQHSLEIMDLKARIA